MAGPVREQPSDGAPRWHTKKRRSNLSDPAGTTPLDAYKISIERRGQELFSRWGERREKLWRGKRDHDEGCRIEEAIVKWFNPLAADDQFLILEAIHSSVEMDGG